MDLNDMILNWLESYPELCGLLATFANRPAIFKSEFPPDQSPGWEDKGQYPRVCFKVDMQINQERSTSGSLQIAIYTDKSGLVADVIEGIIRGRLKDILMIPDKSAPFCVAWSATTPYTFEGSAVVCREMVFDILEYPSQETTDPDPIMALSAYIKNMYPEALVMGLDRVERYTDPAFAPVFFCRLQSLRKAEGHCMHSISWFESRISVHLLCPDASDRLKMISAINSSLGLDEEIIMLDDSPMEIKELVLDNKADYLREGQLTVVGKYGCLKTVEKKQDLRYFSFSIS